MVKSILLLIFFKTVHRRRMLNCFILFLTIPVASESQMVRLPLSTNYNRVRSYSSHQCDAFSFQNNQASLATAKKYSAGIYGERKWLLEELSQYNVGLVLPTASGVFGLAGGYAGNQYYNESQLGLAYGRSLGQLNVGGQFNYYQLKVQGYGGAPSLNFEVGAILKINNQFNTGIHIYNPTSSRIGKKSEEHLPLIFSWRAGYDFSNNFFTGIEIEKVEDQPVNLHAAMEYCFAKKLFARIGLSTATSSFYMGVGFLWNDFRIDVTSSWHQQLGLSPGFCMIYNSNAK